MPHHITGYIEGYYGRLPRWRERGMILDALARHGMTAYFYAPKEDPAHRRHWRDDWDGDWWRGFADFTAHAKSHGIAVIAGIAPGADFDFASLKPRDGDTAMLMKKAGALCKAGADTIAILFDDIDPAPQTRLGDFENEGAAHAAAANLLADNLPCAVYIVPRIYADDITDNAAGYLESFAAHLDERIKVFTCGNYIVAPEIDMDSLTITIAGIDKTRCIIWDNFYAHDYCPRRLYLGRFRGRAKARNIMLNPTGLTHTDCLLLAIAAAGDDEMQWHEVLAAHGIPDEFLAVADFFDAPPDPRMPPQKPAFNPDNAKSMLAALDVLLWEWQTPLAREWYPYMMGLRGDILYRIGEADTLRRAKIFPPLLFDPEA